MNPRHAEYDWRPGARIAWSRAKFGRVTSRHEVRFADSGTRFGTRFREPGVRRQWRSVVNHDHATTPWLVRLLPFEPDRPEWRARPASGARLPPHNKRLERNRTSENGRERDTGARLKGPRRAKPRGRPQAPDVCASLPSIARAHARIPREPPPDQGPLTFIRQSCGPRRRQAASLEPAGGLGEVLGNRWRAG